MPLRQMHEVPNGQNELLAKWAGSAKIPGCYKRIFQFFLLFLLGLMAQDNNIENIRTANANLKVTYRDNNCHISKVIYKEWDYWNFDFSPHKFAQDRNYLAIEFKEYWWQVRKKESLINWTVVDSGGTLILLAQGIKINWFQTFFRSRHKVAIKTRFSRRIARQHKTSVKGTYWNELIRPWEINCAKFRIVLYRMISSSQHSEKRKRDDVDVQEAGCAPMDTSNEWIANTQHVTIGDLQEHKYWNNICQRADELNQYHVDYINEDQLLQVMGLPPTETEEFRRSIKNQRTALLLKKDAIMSTFESFLRTTCTNGNQELEETYRVIGYASRIIYELVNIKVIKEVEAELQLCKGALDRVVLTSNMEVTRNELESLYFGCRQQNLQNVATQFNCMREMLVGVSDQIAIRQLDISTVQQGLEMLEAKIQEHTDAVEKFQPVVSMVKETIYHVASAPPKLPPRIGDTTVEVVKPPLLNISDMADLHKLRVQQRGLTEMSIEPPTYVWKKGEDPAIYIPARQKLIQYLTHADEWIDKAHFVYVLGLNLTIDKADKEAYKARTLKEVQNACFKIGHSAYTGRLAITSANEWVVDEPWYLANIEVLRAKSYRTGFSNGIPVKLVKSVAIAVVGTFNTFRTSKAGVQDRIGRQAGQYVYDMIHMVTSDLEMTAKNKPREYWLVALPSRGQWDQIMLNKSAPLWTLTGVHSTPEDKYVLASEILCARKQTLEELNSRGAGFTEENILPILDQYWTEWDTSTEPPTYIARNRRFEGKITKKPIFLIRMVYVNSSIEGSAAFCPKYQTFMRERFERKFVAYGFRMERFVNEADMETTPIPLQETLAAHQTICLNVVEGVMAKEVVDELLNSGTNWTSLQKAGQVIICPGVTLKYKTVAPCLRIVWLKETITDITKEGSVPSLRNYHPIVLEPIKHKFATYHSEVISLELVSDTRKDFLEVAERFARNARQLTTPGKILQGDSPSPKSKQRKKGTPTKTPKTSNTDALSLSTLSSDKSSSESQITRRSDDGFNQLFVKLMDIDDRVKAVAAKQGEQEHEIRQVRQEAATHREDQSKAQLASILKSLDILSDEIDSLRGVLSAHEESLRQLSEMPATDLREMQKMQIVNFQRSDSTTEKSKVRRFKNLRDEAIRLASATIPPTHLGEYQLRSNDIL
jgi:hypothetical protein